MTDKLVTQIEKFILKQQSQPALEYVDTATPERKATAASAPKPKGGAAPSGKVPTKIYEMVRRGGRVFERVRTAWVNPDVAERLQRSKTASYTHLTLPTILLV